MMHCLYLQPEMVDYCHYTEQYVYCNGRRDSSGACILRCPKEVRPCKASDSNGYTGHYRNDCRPLSELISTYEQSAVRCICVVLANSEKPNSGHDDYGNQRK